MKYWFGVAAAEHVRLGVEGGFCMFAHGSHTAALKLSAGDWVAYYSPRQQIDGGAEVRAFTAIGEVMPGAAAEQPMAHGLTGWYRPVDWRRQAAAADIYPLLDHLSFVKNRSHWGMYFRKSLFSVDRADFALVADAMGVDLPTADS